MNPILALLMVVVGTALAESGQHSSNIQQQYADAMDTFANREAVSSSSGWDSSTTYSYPTSYSYPAQNSGLGFGGNFNLGLPTSGLANTIVSVVLSLVALSFLTQIVSNFLELPFFDKLWKEARSMDSTEMADMARFAMDSFEKFQKLYEN